MAYCLWFIPTWVLAFGSRFVSLMVLGTVVSFKSLSDSKSSAKDRNTASEINSNIHDATSTVWLLSTGIERYFLARKSVSSVSDQETGSRKRKVTSFPAFHKVFLFWSQFWLVPCVSGIFCDWLHGSNACTTHLVPSHNLMENNPVSRQPIRPSTSFHYRCKARWWRHQVEWWARPLCWRHMDT